MTTEPRRRPTPKSPLAFEDFVAGCTPSVWRLRVHAVELDTGDVAAALQTTIPFPSDRDLPRAIGGVFGEAGRFRVSILGRANQTAQAEADRARLQLRKGQNLPRAIVTVTSDDIARGAAVPRQPPAAARGARAAAEDPDVIEAEKRARLAKARQAEATADAAARKAERSDGHDGTAALAPVLQQLLQQTQPKGDGGMAAVLQVLQAGQQQFQALMLQLLQQSQQREQALLAALSERAAPANLPELDNVKRTIETFQGLRELLRSERVDDDRPRGMAETIIDALAPQIGDLLPRLLNRQAPAAAPMAATAGAAAAVPPAPAPAIALPAPSLQGQRVQTFVRALVQEACAGSAPEALADRLASDIDGLPASVRAPLDAGQLDDTIAAILPFLGDDESRTTLQAVARDPHVRPWLLAFAAACSIDDTAEEEPA